MVMKQVWFAPCVLCTAFIVTIILAYSIRDSPSSYIRYIKIILLHIKNYPNPPISLSSPTKFLRIPRMPEMANNKHVYAMFNIKG